MEMALTMTFILILLAGVVDLGRAFFTYITLRDAAQEGALYGSLEPADCSGIVKRARNTSNSPVNLKDATHILVSVNISESGQPSVSCTAAIKPCAADEVTVAVTFKDFPVTMPFLGALIGRQAVDISALVADTILTPSCNP